MVEEFYTTGEAAEAIGVSRQTLQAWIADGKVDPPRKVGNTRVWSRKQVDELQRLRAKGDRMATKKQLRMQLGQQKRRKNEALRKARAMSAGVPRFPR
jgi:excisionase family DNA binding protein